MPHENHLIILSEEREFKTFILPWVTWWLNPSLLVTESLREDLHDSKSRAFHIKFGLLTTSHFRTRGGRNYRFKDNHSAAIQSYWIQQLRFYCQKIIAFQSKAPSSAIRWIVLKKSLAIRKLKEGCIHHFIIVLFFFLIKIREYSIFFQNIG